MAKNVKQDGISFLECILALVILQIFLMTVNPAFMGFIQQKQSRYVLGHLQSSIDWARWMAVIRHEKLRLEPIGDWQKGWRIFADKQLIREYKLLNIGNISIQWHGFSGNGHLIFYPKMASNHLNGYFQIGHQRLWSNRLGHMRVSYGV